MVSNDLDRLRELIAETRAAGGHRLPPEPRLSGELNVSRGRLRTLLKKVEEEGLIWRHVGKGTFIGQRNLPQTPDIAQSVSVDQVMQARSLIESQLAAHAAMHSTPTDISALQQVLDAMVRCTTFEEWKILDDRLHQTVAAATHNPLLVLLYDTLKRNIPFHLTGRLAELYDPVENSRARLASEEEHLVVVEAIGMHDPEAAERGMLAHIQSVRTRLFGGR